MTICCTRTSGTFQFARAQPIHVLLQGRLRPQFCQPHQGSAREILAPVTVVATKRKIFPKRYLEMGIGEGFCGAHLKFLPHTSWIVSLSVQSEFQGSGTVCWRCTNIPD